MDFNKHQQDTRQLRQSNRTLGFAVAVLGLCQMLSLFAISSLIGNERTVLVPPSIDRTFWVSRDQVSREYLEEMASYISFLVLNVSPGDVDWKRRLYLNYAAPDVHADLKAKGEVEADRLRQNNASTSFLIQQLSASERDQSVVLTGLLRRQVANIQVGEPEPRSYQVDFKYAGGRVSVKAFRDITEQLRLAKMGGAAANSAVAGATAGVDTARAAATAATR
jgi:conjugal transfer pilus assembly protein TraE